MMSHQLKSHLKSHAQKHENVQKDYCFKTQKMTPTGLGFMCMQYGPPWEMCMNSPLLVHWTIEGSNSIWNTAFRALDREAVTNNSYLFSKKLHRSLWGLLINALWINQGEVRDYSETSVSLCYLESHEFGIILVINSMWVFSGSYCLQLVHLIFNSDDNMTFFLIKSTDVSLCDALCKHSCGRAGMNFGIIWFTWHRERPK